MKLIVTKDTFLKALPIQTKRIQEKDLPNQLVPLKSGTTLDIIEHFPYTGRADTENDDHLFIQLADPLADSRGIRWFVYGLHVKVEGNEPDNNPKQDEPIEKPKVKTDYGPTISLPGISRPVGIYEPIYHQPKPSNFTWAELTKGGSRIPVSVTITQRIVKLAKYMDNVRAYLGNKSITVTSGYRDPISNRRVGGAMHSRHMAGDAIDFYVDGMSVVDTFYKLKTYHKKGGLAVGNGFVHLDLRPGAPARWLYRGGPSVKLW